MGYDELVEELERVICDYSDVSLRDLANLLQEQADRFREEADANDEE